MDVFDLQEFYADPLGGVARRLIAHRIRARVKNAKGLTIMGLGYATPYLGGWRDERPRCSVSCRRVRGLRAGLETPPIWPALSMRRTCRSRTGA